MRGFETVQAYGASPLFIASQNGHVEVVQVLLGAGADVGQATVSWGMQRGVGCVGYGAVRRAVDAVCGAMCVWVWVCVVRWLRGLVWVGRLVRWACWY